MTQAARLVGIPGAGKTERALQIIEKVRQRGYTLEQIGFCSFTRAARREAAERAAQAFGVSVSSLEKDGWFRTIHSCCAKLLKLPRGSIVNYDHAWLAQALGDPGLIANADEDDGEAWTSQWQGQGDAQIALSLWDVARNRLMPLAHLLDEITYRLGRPPIDDNLAVHLIRRYETAKERDGRLDFCDLLLRYAGLRMKLAGPEEVAPEGVVPPVPVWIFDEAQDTSPLLDRAARRLCDGCIWLYLMGDINQCIYSWAGADGRLFMRWPVAQQEYLRKTWRCSEKIIKAGLKLIRQNDDLTNDLRELAVEARAPGGSIVRGYEDDLAPWIKDPAVPTLIMARTNQIVSQLQARLTLAQVPWQSVRSRARWPDLASTKLADAFTSLRGGATITGEQWRRIVQHVPAKLLVRGTKAFYAPAASKEEVKNCSLATLAAHGGTQALHDAVAAGAWPGLLKVAERCAYDARRTWGDLIDDPPLKVSTIHGTKGMQAERVILCTRIGNGPVWNNLRTLEGMTEERRVWYVAMTRARDHLVLLEGNGRNYKDIYDVI